VRAVARRCTPAPARRHTGDGDRAAVQASVQARVDAVLTRVGLDTTLVARLAWISERRSRGGWTPAAGNGKYGLYGYSGYGGGSWATHVAHSYALTLAPASVTAPPLSAPQKAVATAALKELLALPGVGSARSRAAQPTARDVEALLAAHGLDAHLGGTLRFLHAPSDAATGEGGSCVVAFKYLPVDTHDERALRALLTPPAKVTTAAEPRIRFRCGGAAAEVTYDSHLTATAMAKRLDARFTQGGVRARVRVWLPEPHAPHEKGWRARLVLCPPQRAGGGGGSGGAGGSSDAPPQAQREDDEEEGAEEEEEEERGEKDAGGSCVVRLHAALETPLARFLRDAALLHGIDEVDAHAVVVRALASALRA
jgi:hypothetical protein